MLNQIRVTDALSGELALAPLTPADVVEVPYSPALLLPAPFAASIMADRKFQQGCEAGYESYFDDMDERNEAGEIVFVERFYSLEEVRTSVARLVVPLGPYDLETPLSWRAGFVLGWLSALALTDRKAALEGLRLAAGLVQAQVFAQGK